MPSWIWLTLGLMKINSRSSNIGNGNDDVVFIDNQKRRVIKLSVLRVLSDSLFS